MFNQLLPVFLFLISIFFSPVVFAKGMDVSKSSSFSSADLNFSGGEAVFVRVNTDKEGPTHVLNVKDKGYSTIKTVDLTRSGSSYSASFSAPNSEGYYSLEAKIEGAGVSVTSVKTIKVGSPSEANISVKVSSNVKGTNVSNVTKESKVLEEKDESENQGVGVPEETDRSEESEELRIEDKEEVEAKKGVFETVFAFVENLLKLLKIP